MRGTAGDPRRERDRARIGGSRPHLETCGQDPPGELRGAGRTGVWEQDRELVTADPERAVGQPGLLPQQPPDLGQHRVADAVTLAVVDELELVEIEQHERQVVPVALRLVEEGLELLLEGTVVAEPGEAVDERVLAGLPVRLVELGARGFELCGGQQDLAGHPADEDHQQRTEHDQGGDLDRLDPARAAGQDPDQRRAQGHRQDGGRRQREVQAQTDQTKRIQGRWLGRRGSPGLDLVT